MSGADQTDTESLLATTYCAIYDLARRRMARESPRHTLQPTALVNEAYLRLAQDGSKRWHNPREFFAAAAEAMRRILIEHARSRRASKRGSGHRPVTLEEPVQRFVVQHGLADDELIELHETLDALEAESPQHALVVKLKYFVGMTADEISESVGVSVTTINRQWTVARNWLRVRMTGQEPGPLA